MRETHPANANLMDVFQIRAISVTWLPILLNSINIAKLWEAAEKMLVIARSAGDEAILKGDCLALLAMTVRTFSRSL